MSIHALTLVPREQPRTNENPICPHLDSRRDPRLSIRVMMSDRRCQRSVNRTPLSLEDGLGPSRTPFVHMDHRSVNWDPTLSICVPTSVPRALSWTIERPICPYVDCRPVKSSPPPPPPRLVCACADVCPSSAALNHGALRLSTRTAVETRIG